MPATVKRTDCRTGWQVYVAGRPIATYRRYETAKQHADDINARG